MRATGLVTVSRIVDAFGKEIPTQKAVDYGWITPANKRPRGWNLDRSEIPLSTNLFLDQGRQILAYCLAFRSPIQNYTLSQFGVGTGTRPAATTDVALQAPIALASGNYVGPLDSIDFLSAFVLRAAFTLGLADANGSLITEMGLFTGNSTLIARRVRAVGINKTSDFAPTLTWRIRM